MDSNAAPNQAVPRLVHSNSEPRSPSSGENSPKKDICEPDTETNRNKVVDPSNDSVNPVTMTEQPSNKKVDDHLSKDGRDPKAPETKRPSSKDLTDPDKMDSDSEIESERNYYYMDLLSSERESSPSTISDDVNSKGGLSSETPLCAPIATPEQGSSLELDIESGSTSPDDITLDLSSSITYSLPSRSITETSQCTDITYLTDMKAMSTSSQASPGDEDKKETQTQTEIQTEIKIKEAQKSDEKESTSETKEDLKDEAGAVGGQASQPAKEENVAEKPKIDSAKMRRLRMKKQKHVTEEDEPEEEPTKPVPTETLI